MKVLVLGAGKMTEAILSGLKKSQDLSDWMIYSPSGISAKNLSQITGAQFVSDLSIVPRPDWILVGCKPQQLRDLKINIGNSFNESLFVSMLAAVSEEDQKRILGVTSLVRIMPNLPVSFNTGITLLSSTSEPEKLPMLQALFSNLGTALVVKELELDELTLLTGSGPALFYEFARSLCGCFSSLDLETRERLVRSVIIGAAKNLSSTEENLSSLTDAVTSKGGVTIAVLNTWRERKFADLLKLGIDAGKKRAQELKAILQN
jgi:pyrroline-5-carboxylate reductase